MNKNLEKTQLSLSALKDFYELMGDDIYARIMMDVLIEGIMNEEYLFIFGESKQEGNKIGHCTTGGISDHIQTNGPVHVETTTNLGKKDISDYP